MFTGEASVTDVSIMTPHHTLNAYLSLPQAAERQPGVVVIHDIFGMSADLRRNTDWLAASGYIAVAPDLFSWGGRIQCLRATFRDIAAQSGRSVDDIDAVLRHGKTIVIGNKDPEFRTIPERLQAGQCVVDLVRATGPVNSREGTASLEEIPESLRV